jgi:hypothetical protein
MADRTCSVDECDRVVSCLDMCSAHYARLCRGRDLNAPVQHRVPETPCAADDCDRAARTKGLCSMHYRRWRRTGDVRGRKAPPPSCAVEDCERPSRSHGWCRMHYRRWRRTGDSHGSISLTTAERLRAKLDLREDGCWQWVGALTDTGYGYFFADGRMRQAYRVAYELFVGEIPEGLEIDHLCNNRACVNPEHLEPVTRQENVRRAVERRRRAREWSQQHEESSE